MATQLRGVGTDHRHERHTRDAGGTDPVARCGGASAPAVSNDAKRPASTSGMQLHLIQCLFTVSKTLRRLAQLRSAGGSLEVPKCPAVPIGELGQPTASSISSGTWLIRCLDPGAEQRKAEQVAVTDPSSSEVG